MKRLFVLTFLWTLLVWAAVVWAAPASDRIDPRLRERGDYLYHFVAVENFGPCPPKTCTSGQTGRTRRTNVCTTGVVTYSAKEDDGDRHFRVKHGTAFIVAEIIPTLPMDAPKLEQTVTVCGTRRFDDEAGHAWWEVHPVESWWPAEPAKP